MLQGSRRNRRLLRHRPRSSAIERSAVKLTADSGDAGGWRPPPPRQSARTAYGRVAASSIGPAYFARGAAPPPELVVERATLVPGYLDPASGRPLLGDVLAPVCRELIARACAPQAGRRGRLILVSSPSAGEGKTFVAVNLALALSQGEGRPVVLIDGDARTAGAAHALGWRPEPGLTEALDSDAGLEGLIGSSGLERLGFVPPGRPSAAIAELLAGRRAALLIRELLTSQEDRLAIVDGPPLLAGVVGPALAAHAGQVVLVIAAGRTSQRAIDASLARLGNRDNVACLLARPAAPEPS